jgi:predicted Zn-dependent protease
VKKSIASIAAITFMNGAFALASLQEAESAVQQGHFGRAEALIQHVIAGYPENPRAHYLYAELLARDGKIAAAADEARAARRLDPGIRFTDPANFHVFEAMLREQQVRAGSTADVSAQRR